MKCPYCLEEIIDGALVCRYCGKKQPLGAAAAKARGQRRLLYALGAGAALILALGVLATSDYENGEARLSAAAACNGTLTADQLKAAAQEDSAKSGRAIQDSEETVIALACPSMAR